MDSEKKEECYNVKPVVNWKCIWFTLALAGGYWFLPKKNKWILLALLYFPYIVLAFYDHHYDCKRNMGPTYLAMFYHWAKPQDSKQIKDYKKFVEESLEGYANDPNPLNKQFNENMTSTSCCVSRSMPMKYRKWTAVNVPKIDSAFFFQLIFFNLCW